MKKTNTLFYKNTIRSIDDYRYIKSQDIDIDDYNISIFNIDNEDIQQLDLENLGLYINLRNIGRPHFENSGYDIGYSYYLHNNHFIYLDKANLKGNNVVGGLDNIDMVHIGETFHYIFCYSEDTFDDEYKNKYPQYFLDYNAPDELKDKYYKPNFKIMNDIENKHSRIIEQKQTLTFDEYLTYYEFLKDKYLDRFKISDLDLGKIRIVKLFGLEEAKKIFKGLSQSCLSMDMGITMILNMNDEDVIKMFSPNYDSNVKELIKINNSFNKINKKN